MLSPPLHLTSHGQVVTVDNTCPRYNIDCAQVQTLAIESIETEQSLLTKIHPTDYS